MLAHLMRPLRALGPILFGLSLMAASCIKREAPPPGTGPDASSAVSGPVDVETLPRVSVLGPGGIREFELQGEAKDKVALTWGKVQGQPFEEALHAEVKEASGSEWSVQAQARTAAPIEAGDLLLATFYVRSVAPQENGTTETQFVFELAREPWTKSVTYPIYLDEQWRMVQVRFAAKESYGAGEAQMIFRLGYDPETLEIGGAKVENFKKELKLLQLPSTEVADLQHVPKPVKEELPPAVAGGSFELEVNPDKVLRPISPYVYGVNSQEPGQARPTVRRMGGNRGTAYNWETNASSAGNDWKHVNDDWSCTTLGYKDCDVPGAQVADFVRENQKMHAQSIVEIPMVDYVSADKAGPVSEEEAAPSKRYHRSFPKKPGPLSVTPDLKDDAVYQDELVNLLVQRFQKAGQGGVAFYSLDNEPALWPSTHPRVHHDRTTYAEMVQRSEATASAILDVDPSARILGGVMFGWSEYMSLSSAPDAEQENKKLGPNATYIDFFLASMKGLEQKHKRRLLHLLDVHWYPEVRGTKRITEDDASLKTIAARLQAPRSLWDPTFQEKSWITDQWKKPIQLVPWLKERIAERYPGTELAITEYNFGTGDHVSGGLAQADMLGILGREGVTLATYWGGEAGVGKLPSYVEGAFRLYRNYDGKGSAFGESALETKNPKVETLSIHAAKRQKDGNLTVLVINKDLKQNLQGKLRIAGDKRYSHAEVYRLDPSGPALKALGRVEVRENHLDYELVRLSATLFVLSP